MGKGGCWASQQCRNQKPKERRPWGHLAEPLPLPPPPSITLLTLTGRWALAEPQACRSGGFLILEITGDWLFYQDAKNKINIFEYGSEIGHSPAGSRKRLLGCSPSSTAPINLL